MTTPPNDRLTTAQISTRRPRDYVLLDLGTGSLWRIDDGGSWQRAGDFRPGTLGAMREHFGLPRPELIDDDELARRRRTGVQDMTNPHLYDSDFDPDIEPPDAHID